MILGIDTSIGTAIGLVTPDGFVVAGAESPDPRGHAEVIGSLLSGVVRPGITHVAAGMGPGPFTGLRVGIAAARAFALGADDGNGGRGIPVVPVVSHDAVAFDRLLRAAMTDAPVARFAVVTDARRRELAYTVYDGLDDDGLPVRGAEPALAPRAELDERLAELGAQRVDATAISATMLAVVAARALAAGRTIAPHEPLYLRAPDVTPPVSRPKQVVR